jgi:hypothetical protein
VQAAQADSENARSVLEAPVAANQYRPLVSATTATPLIIYLYVFDDFLSSLKRRRQRLRRPTPGASHRDGARIARRRSPAHRWTTTIFL